MDLLPFAAHLKLFGSNQCNCWLAAKCDLVPDVSIISICSSVSQPALPTVLSALLMPKMFRCAAIARPDMLRTTLLAVVSNKLLLINYCVW